jgi:hypothetical protein
VHQTIDLLGIAQAAFTALVLFTYLLNYGPPEIFGGISSIPFHIYKCTDMILLEKYRKILSKTLYQKNFRASLSAEFSQTPILRFKLGFQFIKSFFQNPEVLYNIALFLFSMLGIFTSQFFFALHLLDIVPRSVLLKNVIRSVTYNGMSLLHHPVLFLNLWISVFW